MKARAGTSLLELLIAGAILSVIVLLTFNLLLRSSATSARLTRAAHLEVRAREFTQYCRATLLTARMSGTGPTLGGTSSLGIHSGYTELRFQVPTDRDAEGVMSFGYSQSLTDSASGTGPIGVIRFEAEEILKESSASTPAGSQPATSWGTGFPTLPALTASVLDQDVNRDGDRSDTYVRGRIMRYAVSAAGALLSSEKLSDSVILQVEPGTSPTYACDMTDPYTAVQEPLFRFVDASGALVPGSVPGTTAVAIVVTVWHGSMETESMEFILRKSTDRVRFRNRQS